ncbi:7448_t:CDS:2, partial [Entrophospora sp. SA101]
PESLLKLLNLCGQNAIYTFEEFLGKDCIHNAVKIGEASFSEVFTSYVSKFTSNKMKSVLKIIPFGRGKEILINGEEQSSIKNILQEIIITLKLCGRNEIASSSSVGFLELYGVGIIYGKYPDQLINQWDAWDEKHNSDNDRPDYFDDKQLYVVMIIEYGGLDLEHVKLKNWNQAWSVLAQVGYSDLKDLHWGNITIKPTKCKNISYNVTSSSPPLDINIPTYGISVWVIDYTLSRIEHDNEIVYVNLSDESYFTSEGDYQYDIYRMMRKETNGDWKSFNSKTNVFWLHYLSDKLLKEKNLPIPTRNNNQYKYYNSVNKFHNSVLKRNSYKSAMEIMKNEEFWKL